MQNEEFSKHKSKAQTFSVYLQSQYTLGTFQTLAGFCNVALIFLNATNVTNVTWTQLALTSVSGHFWEMLEIIWTKNDWFFSWLLHYSRLELESYHYENNVMPENLQALRHKRRLLISELEIIPKSMKKEETGPLWI